MNNIKTNALFFAIIALLFLAFIGTCFLSAADVFHWLSSRYALEGQKAAVLQTYVNPASWLRLQLFLLLLLTGFLFLFYNDRFFIRKFVKAFVSFFAGLVSDCKQLPVKEKRILALLSVLFFVALLGYSALTPWQLDELHSWTFFVNRGPLVTAAYYPSSNNHIAYNLLTLPFHYLFTPLWAMRCVSLFSSLYVIVLFYLIVRRRYSFGLSLIGLFMLMSFGSFLWYAIQGRGYVLELAGLLSLVYTVLNRPINEDTDRLLVGWSAFTCYVLPVAVLPAGLLCAGYSYFLCRSNERFIQRSWVMIFYTIFFTLILYSPVLIFSGAASLVSNPFVKHVAYQEGLVVGVTHYLPAIWEFITGTEGVYAFVLAFVFIIMSVILYFTGDRKVWVPVLLLCIPLVQLMLYPVLLFERTWLWLLLPLMWWILELAKALFGRKQYAGYLFGVSLLLFLVLNNGKMLYDAKNYLSLRERNFQAVKDYLFTERRGETILVDDEVYHLKLRFYQREEPAIKLVQSSDHDASGASVVLVSKAQFKPTDGQVLRSNEEVVLYLPK